MEVIFLSDPADVPLSRGQQQVEQPDEAEQQAEEEQLSEGRDQEPRKRLRREAEVPRGREEAGKADPAKQTYEQSSYA